MVAATKTAQTGWLVLLLLVVFFVTRPKLPTGPAPHSPEYLHFLDKLRAETNGQIGDSIKTRTFLIIGGTGYTGGVLVDDLLGRGAKGVKVLSRRKPKAEDAKSGVQYMSGSILDLGSLNSAMVGVDVVFHTAAAYGSPPNGKFGDYQSSAPKRVNVNGMKNVLKACNENNVELLVFTSSMHTTFRPDKDLINVREDTLSYFEEHESHYSRSKTEAEQLCLAGNTNTKLRTVALRPSGIYGPQENFFIPKIFDLFYQYGKFAPVYFDKDEQFEFTFVYDIAWAHSLAVSALDGDEAKQDKVFGKAFFITDQTVVNSAAMEFARPIMEAIGISLTPIVWVPPTVLVHMAYYMEWFCYVVNKIIGYEAMRPVMTETEAKTLIRSYTVDPSYVQQNLGYYPLLNTGEGTKWAAEEFKRRYEMANAPPSNDGEL